MSPGRRPSPSRRPRAGETGGGGVRPGRKTAASGPAAAGTRPGRPGGTPRRDDVAPPPIEARDARWILAGLFVFAAGLAVGGVLSLLRLGGSPAWSVSVAVGLLGIGAVGLFQRRTISPVPRPAIWTPRYLADVSTPLRLPAPPVAAVFYVLVAIGIVGNLAVPLLRGR